VVYTIGSRARTLHKITKLRTSRKRNRAAMDLFISDAGKLSFSLLCLVEMLATSASVVLIDFVRRERPIARKVDEVQPRKNFTKGWRTCHLELRHDSPQNLRVACGDHVIRWSEEEVAVCDDHALRFSCV